MLAQVYLGEAHVLELLPPQVADQIGVVALVVILGWAIATGRLVTRREHDQAIHDRDEWRAESRLKDQQLAEKDQQLAHLAEVGRTVEQFTRGLQQEMDR